MIEEDEGIFLVTLDANGRCTDFREWFNSRRRPSARPRRLRLREVVVDLVDAHLRRIGDTNLG